MYQPHPLPLIEIPGTDRWDRQPLVPASLVTFGYIWTRSLDAHEQGSYPAIAVFLLEYVEGVVDRQESVIHWENLCKLRWHSPHLKVCWIPVRACAIRVCVRGCTQSPPVWPVFIRAFPVHPWVTRINVRSEDIDY